MTLYSALFDLACYTAAGVSYYSSPTGKNFFDDSLRGAQAFTIASVFDKVVRGIRVKNARGERPSAHAILFHPLVEEAVYSGVLLTQKAIWIIPRFLAALFTGMTAARALTGRVTPKQNTQGLTLDTKIGLLWAISRELVLTGTSPSSGSLRLLDSCVFALAEVCPKNNGAGPSKFSSEWSYKVMSSAFFRLTANTVAIRHGISASIVQHLLFNISQAVQQGSAP